MTVWKNKFIKPNKYSRPQQSLKQVKKIVMHWTANFGATANGHYNYFNTLSGRYASAHLFVDKIEALCIIPLNEISYHANDGTYRGVQELKPNANYLSIGIEMCVEKDGTFHPDMINRAEDVALELCKLYKLNPLKDIVRHYDVTKKSCPAPWVTNASQFTAFKERVNAKMNPVIKPVIDVINNGKTYTVVKGDTFYSIARKLNIDVQTLMKYNPRVNANNLQVGDVIHLIAIPTPVVKPVVIKPIVKPVVKPVVAQKPLVKKLVYKRVLVKGLKGNDVKELQEALNKLNFKIDIADGIFGAKTEDAVRRFQKVYLAKEVDGKAGKNTINKINSLLK